MQPTRYGFELPVGSEDHVRRLSLPTSSPTSFSLVLTALFCFLTSLELALSGMPLRNLDFVNRLIFCIIVK